MALTRSFKETVQNRAKKDRAFREALLQEGIQSLLAGEFETGKANLRDYINATIGFEELGHLTDKSAKSLMRMFSPVGNPQADNLFKVLRLLQQNEGVALKIIPIRPPHSRRAAVKKRRGAMPSTHLHNN